MAYWNPSVKIPRSISPGQNSHLPNSPNPKGILTGGIANAHPGKKTSVDVLKIKLFRVILAEFLKNKFKRYFSKTMEIIDNFRDLNIASRKIKTKNVRKSIMDGP